MQTLLGEILEKGKEKIPYGKTADYIPELGRADKNRLGICVFTRDGKQYRAGDTSTRFTIQSISKVINLAAALERCGFEHVFSKVGMEPSGEAFNSLVELDLTSSYPFNPMINSGAIAVASFLEPIMDFEEMLEFARNLCQDPGITLDEAVCQSEMSHASRNRAIAYLLESKGIIESDVEKSLQLYIKLCSLSVTAQSLANLGLVLACGGTHPVTGERLLSSHVVQVIKTIMLTCGMYDGSGTSAVLVGLPAKSGVGGGILSLADRKMGIGIYGPALDKKGNSIAGQEMLRLLSEKLHLHLFAEESRPTA